MAEQVEAAVKDTNDCFPGEPPHYGNQGKYRATTEHAGNGIRQSFAHPVDAPFDGLTLTK